MSNVSSEDSELLDYDTDDSQSSDLEFDTDDEPKRKKLKNTFVFELGNASFTMNFREYSEVAKMCKKVGGSYKKETERGLSLFQSFFPNTEITNELLVSAGKAFLENLKIKSGNDHRSKSLKALESLKRESERPNILNNKNQVVIDVLALTVKMLV